MMKPVALLTLCLLSICSISAQGVPSFLTINLYHVHQAEAVKGAQVKISYGNDYVERESDSRGRVEIDMNKLKVISGQTIKVKVIKEGYRIIDTSYTVANESNEIEFEMNKLPDAPTMSVIGYVYDNTTREVMSGVKVYFLGDEIATTANDGSFQINLPIAKFAETGAQHFFTFQKHGYTTSQEPVKVSTFELSLRISHHMIPKEEALSITTVRYADVEWQNTNLELDNTTAVCYYDDPNNCRQFGRLYTWDAARKACRDLGDGWRLPTTEEFEQLTHEAGQGYGSGMGTKTGEPLTSYQKMMNSQWRPVLGGYHWKGKFRKLYKEGYYWTATEVDNQLEAVAFYFSRYGVFKVEKLKEYFFSCRCVND